MLALSNPTRALAAGCTLPFAVKNSVYAGKLNLPVRGCVKLPLDCCPP